MTIHLQHLRLQISCIVRPVSAVHPIHHEYGNGESYTATEVHFLKYVVENPGISAIELAHSWNKTRAAATQMLTKLERQDSSTGGGSGIMKEGT